VDDAFGALQGMNGFGWGQLSYERRKTHSFDCPTKDDHFTKTGSTRGAQHLTRESTQQEMRFPQAHDGLGLPGLAAGAGGGLHTA
jgi:hypothetical protein